MLRIIRKYSNRKYYDMQTSRYVSVIDIGLLFNREDGNIKVVYEKDGELIDITTQTLMQVILKINMDDADIRAIIKKYLSNYITEDLI